jgi:hypothetical protein
MAWMMPVDALLAPVAQLSILVAHELLQLIAQIQQGRVCC